MPSFLPIPASAAVLVLAALRAPNAAVLATTAPTNAPPGADPELPSSCPKAVQQDSLELITLVSCGLEAKPFQCMQASGNLCETMPAKYAGCDVPLYLFYENSTLTDCFDVELDEELCNTPYSTAVLNICSALNCPEGPDYASLFKTLAGCGFFAKVDGAVPLTEKEAAKCLSDAGACQSNSLNSLMKYSECAAPTRNLVLNSASLIGLDWLVETEGDCDKVMDPAICSAPFGVLVTERYCKEESGFWERNSAIILGSTFGSLAAAGVIYFSYQRRPSFFPSEKQFATIVGGAFTGNVAGKIGGSFTSFTPMSSRGAPREYPSMNAMYSDNPNTPALPAPSYATTLNVGGQSLQSGRSGYNGYRSYLAPPPGLAEPGRQIGSII